LQNLQVCSSLIKFHLNNKVKIYHAHFRPLNTKTVKAAKKSAFILIREHVHRDLKDYKEYLYKFKLKIFVEDYHILKTTKV